MPDGCGGCTRCLSGCPTGAIVAPGVVDARRCLAWLVQAEGVFPVEHRVALGDRLYGCDDCQEVCPPSRAGRDGLDPVARPDWPDRPGRSAGRAADGPGDWADVVGLLDTDDAGLLARFGRWYIPRRQPRYLRRNALIVLGNSGAPDHPEVRRVLGQALADPGSARPRPRRVGGPTPRSGRSCWPRWPTIPTRGCGPSSTAPAPELAGAAAHPGRPSTGA